MVLFVLEDASWSGWMSRFWPERSVGLPERTIVWRYALRNAAVPLVTMIGVYFANMLGGSRGGVCP